MIRKKALRLALVLFSVLALGMTAMPVTASVPPPPPPPPGFERHTFFGSVTVGGSPAADGTVVSAHIGGLSWATTTKDGQYGVGVENLFYVPKDDPATPAKDGGVDGDVITFKVGGVVATTYTFKAGEITQLDLSIAELPIQLTGVTGEVNCDILSGVTIELFQDGTSKGSTTSYGEGNYSLSVPETGTYDVVASKDGFRDETQTDVVVVLGVNTLHFRGETGLIPNAPNMSYVLKCVNHWLYPPSEECELTMSKVLAVVNAWLYPVGNSF